MTLQDIRVGVLVLLAGLSPASGQVPSSPVEAALQIPVQETYVLGDPIPLVWEFKNVSDRPLAFMWEGCCRLNGKLEVLRAGKPLATLPTGQALAHMFAKAELLAPGMARSYETRVSDWVELNETGDFQLRGHYVGVMPSQQPQVPKGVEVWRGKATTSLIGLSAISARDYLSQRRTRSLQRGIGLELKGPSSLLPIDEIQLRLKISNLTDTQQDLLWPASFQLWVLDAGGRRVGNVATYVKGEYEELKLTPGTQIERLIPFGSGEIEGKAFGTYDLFVDLAAAGPEQPRLPSNPVSLEWRLGPDSIRQLLERAAMGPIVGHRNAHLKLLRVYLSEIQSDLKSIDLDALSAAAAGLARQLRLAARLKPFSPVPGRVEFQITVSAAKDWRFENELLASELEEAHSSSEGQLRGLLDVRRHLGWEVRLNLEPAPDISFRDFQQVIERISEIGSGSISVPKVHVALDPPTRFGSITVRTNWVPAHVVVKIGQTDLSSGVEIAGPNPDDREAPSLIREPESAGPSYRKVAHLEELEKIAAQFPGRGGQVLCLSTPDVTWGALTRALRPFLQQGWAVDISPAP